ncbi:hypothetical protein FBEOM_7866 [Fusarium beomiforme]|uniref:Uncharacterized protein n=1 Tax=Fusarium beomiforme TaxID=44412 RepID=A0A9P5DXS2_9HYPO|nr:hypothetical protein FBEOM_7866 [Fusarium beomiforme]
MTSELAAAQYTLEVDSTSHTPNNSHAQSPNGLSKTPSADAAVPAQRGTRSDCQVGNALFDFQINPFHGRAHGTTASPCPSLPEESKVPTAGLNPYRDGRIRSAVPSKLKGKTNGKQGNFSVMQMRVQKPEMTERDLAAKRTSERTAAAAKLASAQGYRHPRRPRPPHAATSPVPRKSPSNLSRTIPGVSESVAQSPPLAATMSYAERQVEDKVLQEISAGSTESAFTEGENAGDIETENPAESLEGKVAPGVNEGQGGNPFEDEDAIQVINMEPSNETPVLSEPTQDNHKEQSAISNPATTTLSLEEIRAEQTRLLELLRKLRPTTVVETLCRALAQFGCATSFMPPPDSRLPEGSSKSVSGGLFISLCSEVFPPNFVEDSTVKRSSKPPTGRPRGRPKGSTKKPVQTGSNLMRTAFTPLDIRPDVTNSTQPSPLIKGPGALRESVVDDQGSDLPFLQVWSNQSSNKLLPRVESCQSLMAATLSSPPRSVNVPGETQRGGLCLSVVPAESTSTTALALSNALTTTSGRTKSTGRPRGRPKGSRNKPRLQPAEPSSFSLLDSHPKQSRPQSDGQGKKASKYKSLISSPNSNSLAEPVNVYRPILPFSGLPDPTGVAASTTQGAATRSPDITQEKKSRIDTVNSIINKGVQGPNSHNQDATQVSSKKRKNLHPAPHANPPVVDTPQAPSITAQLVTSQPHVEQVKRLSIIECDEVHFIRTINLKRSKYSKLMDLATIKQIKRSNINTNINLGDTHHKI